MNCVHPLSPGSTGIRAFNRALGDCQTDDCPDILRIETFDFAPDLFLNINHMAQGAGMRGFTEQLIQEMAACLVHGVPE